MGNEKSNLPGNFLDSAHNGPKRSGAKWVKEKGPILVSTFSWISIEDNK